MIERVRPLLGRTGLLYTGDCKMAALETRAAIAARGDFYLTSLPMTGATKDQFEHLGRGCRQWRAARRVGRDPHRRGHCSGPVTSSPATRRPPSMASSETWTERVQVIRSDSLAETQTRALERRLEKAEAAVRALTPPPGPGRAQFTTGWELERAVAAVLAEHEVTGCWR